MNYGKEDLLFPDAIGLEELEMVNREFEAWVWSSSQSLRLGWDAEQVPETIMWRWKIMNETLYQNSQIGFSWFSWQNPTHHEASELFLQNDTHFYN